VSSNPAGRVSREFSAKNAATSMETGGRWPVAASPEFFFEKFCYYFWVFSHFHFAECKSLPSVLPALGKEAFAVKGYADSSLLSAKPSLSSVIALGKTRVCCSVR